MSRDRPPRLDPEAGRTVNEIEEVIEQQRCWAEGTGRSLATSGHRFAQTKDALFGGELDRSTRAELAAGAGGELGRLAVGRLQQAIRVAACRSRRRAPWVGTSTAAGHEP